jgi:putative nucleotidyltransferase with HDIG domain
MAIIPKQHVPAGNYQISQRGPLILEAYLGTCVGLALYCQSSGVGGLIHLLLPESPTPYGTSQPEKYAATGVPMFINALINAGAQRPTLTATMAGGALVGPLRQLDLDLDIGGRTAEVTKHILAAQEIELVQSETGGFFTCCLRLDMATGQSTIEPAGTTGAVQGAAIKAPSANEIQQAIERLKPIPQVALKVLRLINEKTTDINTIAKEIRRDQVITARTLQLANSALYATKQTIASLDHAIVYLGQDLLVKLVITAAVQSYFEQSAMGYALCKGGLYHHALGCAHTAEMLARTTQAVAPSEAYTAGLLHDIGKVVLDQYVTSAYPLFYRKMVQASDEAIDIEQRVLGTDHTKIGYMLARKWSFPPALANVVRHHHHPEKAGDHSKLATIAYLADVLMARFHAGLELECLDTRELETHLNLLGLTIKNMAGLVDAIPQTVFNITNETIGGAKQGVRSYAGE